MIEPEPPSSFAPAGRTATGKVALVVAIVGVTVACVGFFAGTRGTERLVRRPHAETSPSAAVSAAVPRYLDMGREPRGPNRDLYVNGLAGLVAPRLDPFTPVSTTPEMRRALIEARRLRRAYDGAPPTIPHAVDERSSTSCLSCHGVGVRIGGKIAPLIPHETFTSCTQCHVPMRTDDRPASSFAGVASPGPGSRAWPGAPPTIPHGTRMRSECQSCHGVGGLNGIHTPHPYRESCTQCHVPQGGPNR